MKICVLVLMFTLLGACRSWSAQESAETPIDIATLTSQLERHHDTIVYARGVVVAVSQDEGGFVDIVPMSGKGDGVLVSVRHVSSDIPRDAVGKIAVVKGTFYCKVYPYYRLEEWRRLGWREREMPVPGPAKVFRMTADSIEFDDPNEDVDIQETPLEEYTSPVIDLNRMEFEAARMGTGKKCLAAGAATPEHSSGRYHELVIVIEGELSVTLGDSAREVNVSSGEACYVPPNTRHSIVNMSGETACYIFVYSLPE